MNLYTSLTLRYLKQNKRRTLVTIIGIILATALICGIGNICTSFMDYQMRDQIKTSGSFYATFTDMDKEKAEVIKKDPRYGRIICRCENITEGEIVDAIHRKCGAKTLNGVKRRVRPGAGRCQGGFCGPRVQEILARELGEDLEEIVMEQKNSYILTGKTK